MAERDRKYRTRRVSTASPNRTGWAKKLPLAAGVLGLLGTGLSGCGSSNPSPTATLRLWLADWEAGNYSAMAGLADNPPVDLIATYQQAAADLPATSATTTAAPPLVKGSTATAALTRTLTVAGYGQLTLRSTLKLQKVAGRWLVEWSPDEIADQLGAGDRFSVVKKWPTRAAVVGAGGASLTPAGVRVGLVGQRIKDSATLSSLLIGAGFSPAAVSAALASASAHPDQLIPLGVLSLTSYEALKAQAAQSPTTTNLYSIGGTTFSTGVSAPLTPDLGAHIVGTVGAITADELHTLGAPYDASSQVGQNGIESAYERRLAGTPAETVEVVDSKGAVVSTLGSTSAVPGQPVSTTIDPVVQTAAEAALNSADPTKQAALVVLRASTGEILASVSRPLSGFDVALDAQVPPGSTFKVVTTTALIEHGANPATPTTCPKSLVVDGQTFTNFEGEAPGSLTLSQAFAISCNTAFIQLAAGLPGGQSLVQAASLFGLGTSAAPGLPVADSHVATPASPNELAATAIGQGQTTVSPLAMASVAAAADSGAYHPPRLVVGAGDDSAAATPLPASVTATLHTLMSAVVTSGTASKLGLPAGTAGKTGTAEFGSGPNPQTHAWFIGYRGDLAFAVFVYGGGVGGPVCAPIAAKLLDALPAAYSAGTATAN